MGMKRHRYRVTVEHLADRDGQAVSKEPLQFEVLNHDDVLDIVQKLKSRTDLDIENIESLAIGLKLFGEVLLDNRKKDLFTDFFPHFADFMKKLKQKPE